MLCRKLDDIWEANLGSEVLFMWTSFLAEAALDVLQLQFPLDLKHCNNIDQPELDTRAVQEVESIDLLVPALIEYNKQEELKHFEKSVFQCLVCFVDKFGLLCVRFVGCGHVYCKECMRDYFTVQIQDGNVMALECPNDKCESQAHPAQVCVH